jgi:hypothetical protein
MSYPSSLRTEIARSASSRIVVIGVIAHTAAYTPSMKKRRPVTPEQRQLREARALLVAGLLGIATAFLSGIALVPRVKLVEVFIVVASSVGAGAALTASVGQFREARKGFTGG